MRARVRVRTSVVVPLCTATLAKPKIMFNFYDFKTLDMFTQFGFREGPGEHSA